MVDFRDPSFTVSYAFLWSMLELPFAIIIASLPVIKPLIAEFAPTLITKGNSSRGKGSLSRAATYEPDGGHQATFHRLQEGVYSQKAAKFSVVTDEITMGDGPEDRYHYNEVDVVKDTKFSRR
ncbi:MAG: hypothetical protein Q9195_003540 [Heterodermia aff. obscurata]